jgi:hypothetical protein
MLFYAFGSAVCNANTPAFAGSFRKTPKKIFCAKGFLELPAGVGVIGK